MLTQRTKTATPRSTATTAFELLDDVITAIKAEPLRLAMPTWFWRKRWGKDPDNRIDKMPACGTVGCVAGWIVALHDGVGALTKDSAVMARATLLLDEDDETPMLFSGTTLSRPQTKAHVQEVVERIRFYQGRHEIRLKAKDL